MVSRTSSATHARKYRETHPDYYAKHIKKVLAWRARNPDKHKAHQTVYYAVKVGKLVKPDTCSRCGEVKAIFAHHPDYSKPLDVVWVCDKCHKAIHRESKPQAGRKDVNGDANKCRAGHKMTPDNTYRHPRGTPECRKCRAVHRQKYLQKVSPIIH